MRILIVDHYAGASHQRGLYRALARLEGANVTLLIPDRWNDGFFEVMGEEETSGNFRVIAGQTVFRGRTHRAVTFGLWSLLRKHDFDLLYLNAEPENFQTLYAIIGRRLLAPSLPIILMSWRNIDFPQGVYPYRAPFLHSVCERFTVTTIDALIAHNEAAKNIFSSKGLKQIEIIPPWVDTEVFAPGSKADGKRRLGITGYTIGYVGRLVAEKGVDLLFQVSAGLKFPHEVLVVGAGPEEKPLRTLAARLGISHRIHWIGPIPKGYLAQHLQAMDVLVLPSCTTPLWREQFGRILIEAMSCGVPVIGSDSGEIPRTIGAAGLIFPERDASALTLQLERMHDDPGLSEELSNRSRDRAESVFSTKVVAGLYLSFFNSVCSAKLLDS
jgi:glycosyltransferase involved in cell wall biosynthesis